MLQTKIKIDESIKVSNAIHNFLMPEKVYFKTTENLNNFENNFVYKGDYLTSKIISSVSGYLSFNNNLIEIVNDYRELKKSDKGVNKINNNYDLKYLKNILNDLNINYEEKNYQELIINAISSNPYDVTNIFLFRENIYLLLETLNALRSSLNIEKTIIYVSSNYSNIIDKILNKMGSFPYLNLKVVETIYPLANNKVLKRYLNTSKKQLFISLNDLYNIGYYFKKDIYPIEKLITVSGPLVENPLVVYVKIGTLLKDILNDIDLKEGKPLYILNNLVNGLVIKPDEYLINNDTEAILVITDEKEISFECIRCGLCHKVCPLKTTYGSNKCIKCGLCSYHCPAKINKGSEVNETSD